MDDRKIFKDLAELSGGNILLNEEEHKLMESRDLLPRANPNNNQKKNNFQRKGR